ncbi:MAG: hypothetical protein U1A27_06985 [Phycisphaerae bacterium]
MRMRAIVSAAAGAARAGDEAVLYEWFDKLLHATTCPSGPTS